MIKAAIAAGAVVALVPFVFVVLLAGPQAATESAGVATACRLVLGMAPQPNSTVAELGGPDAAAVAAALSQPAGQQPGSSTPPAPPPVPAEVVAEQLQGERAYDFVSTLNTIDNWRTLPVDVVARWAINPPATPLPDGARLLPGLPADQVNALQVDEQPDSAYARGCAAVISRATQLEVHPAGEQPGAAEQPRDIAALAAQAGTTMTNLDLLRRVDPAATQDDPRQFYLNYRPVAQAGARDIVVYDFTIAGPAHFGIAVDAAQMVTTGSFGSGVVEIQPVPTNAGAMAATPLSDDQRKPTSRSGGSSE
jgi:hypothetical protein